MKMRMALAVAGGLLAGLQFLQFTLRAQAPGVRPATLARMQNLGISADESRRPVYLPPEWGYLVAVESGELHSLSPVDQRGNLRRAAAAKRRLSVPGYVRRRGCGVSHPAGAVSPAIGVAGRSSGAARQVVQRTTGGATGSDDFAPTAACLPAAGRR